MSVRAEASQPGLRRLNILVGLAHLAQAVVLLAVAPSASLPVQTTYLDGPPGAGERGGPVALLDVPIAPAIAAFLLLAAVDHLAMASPWARGWYERNVRRGVNPARWWEYSISSSLMIVLIAQLTGIAEAAALLAIFGVNAAMILFGLLMERANVDRSRVTWAPFVYGCLAGVVPWLAVGLQILVAQENADGGVPGFVIGIFVSLFALFNSFALNMWLQYRRIGRWRDPVFAERVYLLLSLLAKTALAWQVYAGALAGG